MPGRRAAVVLAALLCACSGARPHTDRDTVPTAHPPSSGTFHLTITANGTGRTRLLEARGSFDRVGRRYSMEMELAALVPHVSGALRMIVIHDTVYIDCAYLSRLVGAPTRWISAPNHHELGMWLLPDPIALIDAVPSGDVVVERGAGGLVRRVVMRFDAAREGGAVVTLEYSDATPVTIEPPPSSEVTDEAAVFEHIAGRTGG